MTRLGPHCNTTHRAHVAADYMRRVRLAYAALRLTRLPRDWDTYGAERITWRAAAWGAWLALTMRPAPGCIVPTNRGGVQLEWHTAGVDFELELDRCGRLVSEDE